jgi:hypothetical protein
VLLLLLPLPPLQALITGAYSMVHQGMAMGCFPRFRVHHTSDTVGGQIYISEVCRALACMRARRRQCCTGGHCACSNDAAPAGAQQALLACLSWLFVSPAGQLDTAGAVRGGGGWLSVQHRHRQRLR